MRMFQRKVFFEGTKDRLHRFIQRQNGKLIDDQRFTVVYRIKSRRGAHTQCVRGQYKKAENGYDIHYFVLPTIWNVSESLLLMALVGIIYHYIQEDPTALYIMIVLFGIAGYFVQRARCIRKFEADCKK